MLPEMLDDLRKKMELGIGSISKQSPDELAGSLVSRAREAAGELTGLAAGILEWSSAARETLVRDIRELVDHQVAAMGLATRDELRALTERVDRLEKAGGTTPRRRKPAAAKTAPKTPPPTSPRRASPAGR